MGEQGSTKRLLSLDAFRGITIAGMILVNNPGSWNHVYPPFRHAPWHGWTPTDLVFPFFLFIVGASMSFAFTRRKSLRRIVRRSVTLFGLGLFMAAYPYFRLDTLRIPGVLQRIAVCYLVASMIVLHTSRRAQIAVIASLLLSYWAILNFGDFSMAGNLAASVDRLVLGGHLWKESWDPEGILSTLPAVATTLIGFLVGEYVRLRPRGHETAAALFALGWVGILAGLLWSIWFPINKNLWTSSYVVFTAGAALQFLAFLYWIVDVREWRRWITPAVVFGRNALAVFVLSGLVAKSLMLFRIESADGSAKSLYQILYETLFASWAGPLNGSLAFALATVLFWWGVLAILYRRRIFLTL